MKLSSILKIVTTLVMANIPGIQAQVGMVDPDQDHRDLEGILDIVAGVFKSACPICTYGRCCNYSGGTEYYLLGEACEWKAINHGECAGGPFHRSDCEGMTCGGGFYYVEGSSAGACVSPRRDSPPYDKRRWTPTKQQCDAQAPKDRGCPNISNVPPGYVYDTRRSLLRGGDGWDTAEETVLCDLKLDDP